MLQPALPPHPRRVRGVVDHQRWSSPPLATSHRRHWWCRHALHFMTASRERTMCLCLVALSCSRCDIVNPTLQIRPIGRRSAVALSSPMRPITADAPVSDVRHQHRSYTRKFHGPRNFRFVELSFPRAKRPGSETVRKRISQGARRPGSKRVNEEY